MRKSTEPEEEYFSADDDDMDTGASSSTTPAGQRVVALVAGSAKDRKQERSHLRMCARWGPTKKQMADPNYDAATWIPPPSRVHTQPAKAKGKEGKGKGASKGAKAASTKRRHRGYPSSSASEANRDFVDLTASPDGEEEEQVRPMMKARPKYAFRPHRFVGRGPMAMSNRRDPPPICNRVAAEWGQEPLPCHCDEWPQWLADHAEEWELLQEWGMPSGTVHVKGDGKPPCAYYRPGGNNMKERHFYDAVLLGIYKLKLPWHRRQEPIFSVN